MITPELKAAPELVTADWLTDVLHFSGAIDEHTRVTGAVGSPIGTGQMGSNVRYALQYDGSGGPATVVCKFASSDADSAKSGVASGSYEIEVEFYRALAPTLDVSHPRCHFAAVETGTAAMTLVMEDLMPATQGDQIAGATPVEAELAIREAARLHGPRWGDGRLVELDWLSRERRRWLWRALPKCWDVFVDQYGAQIDPVTVEQGKRLLDCVDILRDLRPAALTPVHGDFRLDNLMFHPTGAARPITVVDWQTLRLGAGLEDVAYFLGTAFVDARARRVHERDLVKGYHEALCAYGVRGYTFDQCWTEYRRYAHAGLIMAVIASTNVGRTKRGDQMFIAMAQRSAQMADDLDTTSLLVSI